MSCVRLNSPEGKEMEDGNKIVQKETRLGANYGHLFICLIGEETVANVGIIMQTHCVYFFSFH